MKCPCDSGKPYASCCEAFLKGEAWPKSPEALMRSRYTAYTQVAVDYLHSTLAPESRADFDAATTRKWAKSSAWHGLKIVEAKDDVVEFVASYEQEGTLMHHHERSRFRKDEAGHWLFVDGEVNPHMPAQKPIQREAAKVGRNDPCPCGSGQKFKKCCG